MTDTQACATCGAQIPTAAAFCTTCGTPVAPPVAADPTVVETPGLSDPTQVSHVEAQADTPLAPPPPVSEWGQTSSQPPAPMASSTSAPWNPPASPPTPTWQQPTPPPTAPVAGVDAWAAPATAPIPGATGMPISPASAAAAGVRMPSVLGGLLCLAGAALALVGVFTAWVSFEPAGDPAKSVSAWALTTGDERIKTATPYLVIVVALLAIAIGVVLLAGFARTLARVGAVLAGVAIVAITALSWMEIASWISDNEPSDFKANTAIGFYLAIAGGVLVAASALLPAKQKV